jgi:hypothetical protein
MSSPCRARINQSADVSNSNVKVKRRTEVPNYSEKKYVPVDGGKRRAAHLCWSELEYWAFFISALFRFRIHPQISLGKKKIFHHIKMPAHI